MWNPTAYGDKQTSVTGRRLQPSLKDMRANSIILFAATWHWCVPFLKIALVSPYNWPRHFPSLSCNPVQRCKATGKAARCSARKVVQPELKLVVESGVCGLESVAFVHHWTVFAFCCMCCKPARRNTRDVLFLLIFFFPYLCLCVACVQSHRYWNQYGWARKRDKPNTCDRPNITFGL